MRLTAHCGLGRVKIYCLVKKLRPYSETLEKDEASQTMVNWQVSREVFTNLVLSPSLF